MNGRSRLAVLVALVALVGVVPSARGVAYPTSLAATGDSITMAFNTGSFPYVDNPSGSWATGTSTTVLSIADRSAAALKRKVTRYNDAKSGAKMADLPGQMTKVANQKPKAVTILMGGNDVCTSSVATMTSVQSFSDNLDLALSRVPNGTVVYMASIPDVAQLWSLFKDSATARSVWSTFTVCQSMLANPTSTLQADIDRRAAVVARLTAFNGLLAAACGRLGGSCVWDGYDVYETAFATSDVTSRDYFHPSLAGQAKLASRTWAAWGF